MSGYFREVAVLACPDVQIEVAEDNNVIDFFLTEVDGVGGVAEFSTALFIAEAKAVRKALKQAIRVAEANAL